MIFGVCSLVIAASAADAGLTALVQVLSETRDESVQLDILRGMSEAL